MNTAHLSLLANDIYVAASFVALLFYLRWLRRGEFKRPHKKVIIAWAMVALALLFSRGYWVVMQTLAAYGGEGDLYTEYAKQWRGIPNIITALLYASGLFIFISTIEKKICGMNWPVAFTLFFTAIAVQVFFILFNGGA